MIKRVVAKGDYYPFYTITYCQNLGNEESDKI